MKILAIKDSAELLFPTIAEAARRLGLPKKNVEIALETGDSVDGWVFDIPITRGIGRQKEPIVSMNPETGETREYSSINETARSLGVAYSSVLDHLEKGLSPMKGVYLFRKEEVSDGEFSKALRLRMLMCGGTAVEVKSPDGKVHLYSSVARASKALDISPFRLLRLVAEGSTVSGCFVKIWGNGDKD